METMLKDILRDIAEQTYGRPVAEFRLKISAEQRKGFHGRYWPDKCLIEIYNLYRSTDFIISTTIHELAHHITNTEYNECNHNKLFYKVFKELLETAVKMGYVDYEKDRKKEDSKDIRQMEKYFGPVTVVYNPEKNPNTRFSMLKIRNSFSIKEELKGKGYTYNGQEKLWQKKISNDEIEQEKEEILQLDSNVDIEIMSFDKITIDVYYYIIVLGNTFDKKDILKEMGYRFNGYFQKNNTWIKKVEGKSLNEEKEKLRKIGLSCSVKTKLR